MLVDSHCHLDFPDFAEDFEQIMSRAAEANVGLMLTICTHLSRFPRVLAVAERFDNVYCSVGIHPHEAGEETEVTAEQLVELAKHPKVVGFGETGLDYYYEHSPREAQKRSFRAHIEAARIAQLPIIIHTRDADDDTIAILEEEMGKGTFPGLVHCFSSSRALGEKAVELGLYISLSGILTFKKSEDLRDTARDLPLEKLLVETDSPFLAPIPHRGKRCEPAFVAQTAAVLADIKGLSPAALADVTTDNFFSLFTKVPR
ncbi:MAG TPA: TatD family hydrolase [Magnetospirillaceae bacterium]|nr:TatD family hydrolase [Magnetospirillaceae bacterium]